MSKIDFEKYYEKIGDQYHELVSTLKELEEYAINNPVDPSMIENMKNTIEPIKQSFQTVSYIKYLLDLPKRKNKIKKFKKQNKKLLNKFNKEIEEGKIKSNDNIIRNIKDSKW